MTAGVLCGAMASVLVKLAILLKTVPANRPTHQQFKGNKTNNTNYCHNDGTQQCTAKTTHLKIGHNGGGQHYHQCINYQREQAEC